MGTVYEKLKIKILLSDSKYSNAFNIVRVYGKAGKKA